MIETSIQAEGLDDVFKLLENLPETLATNAKKIFNRTALRAHASVSRNIGNGTPLYNRTGNLKRSLKPYVEGNKLADIKSGVYTDVIYAPIQEAGGTIRAKNAYLGLSGAPYLNIPSDYNKTPAGVQRLSARDVFNRGGYIVPINGAKARYAVMLDGRPMFWLVNEVTIPARLGMRKAADEEVPTLLSELQSMELEP